MQMMRIQLCALKRDRKKILEYLQRLNFVEVYDAGGGEGDPVFKKQDTRTACSLLNKNAESCEKAVEVLDKYVPYKSPSLAFLRGREALSPEQLEQFALRREKVLTDVHDVLENEREITEAKTDILRIEGQMEALKPWLDLPISQMSTGTKRTTILIGQMEGRHTEEDILAQLAQQDSELDKIHIEMVYVSDELTCMYAVVLKEDAHKAEVALRSIGFVRPASPTHRVPANKQKHLEKQLEIANAKIDEATSNVQDFADKRQDFLLLRDECLMRGEKYGVIEKLALSNHTFVLNGFVATPFHQDSKKFIEQGDEWVKRTKEAIEEKFTCSVNIWAAVEEPESAAVEVPVKLKNSWFAEPVETVLEDYSMPGKGELDPTGVMSFFYYLMFGLMFSDAGYGFVMALLCGLALVKFKNMEPIWSKYVRMYFWCGVSTTFWGIMFSSYFGDVVTVFTTKFAANPVVIKPLWLSPMDQPMLLLVFCLGLGIVHMTVGMIMKAATLIKNKQYPDIIYDVVFSLIVLYGLVINLIGTELFEGLAGFKVETSATVQNVCWVLVVIGIVGIMFFGGRESKSWGKRLMKGAYAVYNTLAGWLGDILSYSRLLALGLATGVIASVMNMMGAMVGSGIVGLIAFIIVFAVGQTLNFGINVLGAYVHSNRLEYVEFFGKFYEGGGRKFVPFGINTKHYKII